MLTSCHNLCDKRHVEFVCAEDLLVGLRPLMAMRNSFKGPVLMFIGIPMMMYYTCLETTRTVDRELYLSSGGNVTD